VTRDTLLDTGPLVAVLDRHDQWHERCAQAWPSLIARCVTTEAVVTEACHLVLRGGGATDAPLTFLLSADIPIVSLETAGHRAAAALMRRYAGLPMDFADAALVVLGEALGVKRVFTTDRRGFSAYRQADGKPFRVLPP
jgi:predicted nucleic acid-binding protein